MSQYFGFDPSSLSDDELLTRQTQLQGKLAWASRFGSMELMSGIQRMLEVIEFERFDRFQRSQFTDRLAASPSVIETEPSLKVQKEEPKPVERAKVAASPERRVQPAQRMTIARTARPTNNQSES
jgi:hypothetical protein